VWLCGEGKFSPGGQNSAGVGGTRRPSAAGEGCCWAPFRGGYAVLGQHPGGDVWLTPRLFFLARATQPGPLRSAPHVCVCVV
jgi:hypothetical protein